MSLTLIFLPLQGLNEKQFQSLYKRSFHDAINPAKLANSVFRLCDRYGTKGY